MLRQAPQIIDSLNTSRLWDLTLFQLESDTHTFGIPGETWCFQCDTNFQVEEQPNTNESVFPIRIYSFKTSYQSLIFCTFVFNFQLACDKQRHIILVHEGTVGGENSSR